MAEELLSFAVEAILKKIVEEINLTRGLKAELKKLQDKSSIVLALLSDAETRQMRGKTLKQWLKNLKNVAYKAEDVLDEFAFEMLRRKLETNNRTKNKIRNSFSRPNPIAFRFKMAHKVQDIISKLDLAVEEGTKLGLHQAVVISSESFLEHREIRLTHPFLEASRVLGRENDTSAVVRMLCQHESEKDWSVMSIVGMAGLGKTKLAQLVFKDEGVTNYFDKKIWVCVSLDFNVPSILKQIGEFLSINVGGMSNIQAIVQKLQEAIKGKKCLLVLDDVWNTDVGKWDEMRNSLLGIGAAKESKILVTTRSEEVVSTMEAFRTHLLKRLSEDDSWALFQERAFATGALAQDTPYANSIGRRLAQRCKGVPLAIMTIGALMHSKKEDQWPSIEGATELWDLSNDESGIMPALRLSFHHLQSSHLKTCFAYCAIFPKDFVFDTDNLILLWIAQGFIQQVSNLEPEEIGNDYFMILLWNSLFQDVEKDKYGNIRRCKMHDLVHDLARSVSKSECLALDSNEVINNIEVRHLSLANKKEGIRNILKENASILRTLFFSGDCASGDCLRSFKCLYSLNLEGARITELSTSIGNLTHLRYLNLSKTDIVALPASIGKLYFLQTLRLIRCPCLREFPEEIQKLANLRHLCFDRRNEWYPYFDPYRIKMPAKLGQLTTLQTLSCYTVSQDNGYRIDELGSLSKLRGKLRIYNLEHVRDGEEAKRAKLFERTRVYKLKLAWTYSRESENNEEDVLGGLQPPPNLKSFSIKNFGGGKFPSWMIGASINSTGKLLLPQSLVKIKLIFCKYCKRVPTLGELPFLRFLEISGMDEVKCLGPEFYSYGSDSRPSSSSINSCVGTSRCIFFPALEEFTLSYMESLVEWRNAPGATTEADHEDGNAVVVFPKLEKLTITYCSQLKTAPTTQFPSLRVLSLDRVNFGEGIPSNVTSLEFLSIENSRITCLPDEWLLNNKQLIQLEMSNCKNLTSTPSVQGLTRLGKLVIRWCDEIIELPSGLGCCTSLESLEVKFCHNLRNVPEKDIRELKSLSVLEISYCANLKSLQLEEFLHCLTCLEELRLGPFCEDLDFFPFSVSTHHIQQLPHLKKLELYGWEKLKSLPNHLQYLTSLQSLEISSFDGVVALPEWLGNLSSLQVLFIEWCLNLEYLPSEEAMRRLNKLTQLTIDSCPLLVERCRKGSGPEWSKISHIPHLEIIDEFGCTELQISSVLSNKP